MIFRKVGRDPVPEGRSHQKLNRNCRGQGGGLPRWGGTLLSVRRLEEKTTTEGGREKNREGGAYEASR